MSFVQRSSLSITFSVWKALFIREILTRFLNKRAGWFWTILEPTIMVMIHAVLWGMVRTTLIAGVNGGIFIIFGVLGFQVVAKTAVKSSHAVRASGSLFSYRQVLPVDTILVRALVEGCIYFSIIIISLIGFALAGYDAYPEKPGQVVFGFCGLWGLGLGTGLILGAVESIVPEIQSIIDVAIRGIYFFSAAFYPLIMIPRPMRDWLLFNPIVHGIELMRGGFFHQFQTAPEVSPLYLTNSVLVAVFLGLALQMRFSDRILSE